MRLSQYIALSLVGVSLLTVGCESLRMPTRSTQPHSTQPGIEIRAVLNQQESAWNAGDLSRFMSFYARSEQTRFASGGDVSVGWQTVYDRYQKRYGNGTGMGTLTFSDIQITPLEKDALAFGRWQLRRDTEVSSGLFTLLFRNTPEGWRIVHDHTSSATKP
jgi:ketosteroid isomerase-like protein